MLEMVPILLICSGCQINYNPASAFDFFTFPETTDFSLEAVVEPVGEQESIIHVTLTNRTESDYMIHYDQNLITYFIDGVPEKLAEETDFAYRLLRAGTAMKRDISVSGTGNPSIRITASFQIPPRTNFDDTSNLALYGNYDLDNMRDYSIQMEEFSLKDKNAG